MTNYCCALFLWIDIKFLLIKFKETILKLHMQCHQSSDMLILTILMDSLGVDMLVYF